MNVRFPEDVVPLSDLRVNPGKMVSHVAKVGCPTLLTSRGRGVAGMQSVADFEASQEESAFMKAVAAGFADLEDGRESSLKDAKARLGL